MPKKRNCLLPLGLKDLSQTVRVVGQDARQIGLLTVAEATQAAASEGAELVVIAPRARPPVCRIVKRSIPSGRQVGGKTQS